MPAKMKKPKEVPAKKEDGLKELKQTVNDVKDQYNDVMNELEKLTDTIESLNSITRKMQSRMGL